MERDTTADGAVAVLIPPGRRLSRALDWLLVVVAAAGFVALAAWQWHLPGLYNDEAYDVVPAMQLVLGQPVDLNRGVGLHLFGRDFPLMISDYQGVSSMYVVLPLFALFGPGVGPLRAMTIAFGALAVLLVYPVGRRLFGRVTGVSAALLLATAPSLIFWSRVGVYVVNQLVPLALGALLCCLRWRERRNPGWLALAGFLAGIGLSTKILFVWLLVGAVAAGVGVWLVNWRWPLTSAGEMGRRQPFRVALGRPLSITRRELVATAAGLLLGAAPLIGYNLASAGTFKVIVANLGQTEKGVDNTAFRSNLTGRFGALKTVLEGSYFWFFGEVHANQLVLPAFVLAATGALLITCGVSRFRRWRNIVIFLLLLILVVLVESSFTLSGLEATHLLVLLPLPCLLIGAGLQFAGGWLRDHLSAQRMAGTLLTAVPALVVIAPLIGGNLLVTRDYHTALARTGGQSSFSTAINDLAAYLAFPHHDSFDYRRPYALDWGMKYNVELLTRGQVQPQEIYGQSRALPADFDITLDALFANPDAVYIAHRAEGVNPPAAYPNRLQEFLRYAEARGKRVIRLKVIYESGGTELFYVYSVRDP